MGGFRLRVLNRDIELADGDYTIGRSRDCDIPISDDLVSRKHASLNVRSGRATVEDLGSRNGTYLNGNRLENRAEVGHLDQITVGAHDLMCIEDQRVRDSPPLYRCAGCALVVDPHDVFCRKCGAPIRNSMALVSDRPSPPSYADVEDTQATATGSSSALGVLSAVATRMMTAQNYHGAERVLERALLDLLQEVVKSGRRPDELSLASESALELAENLKSERWVEWTFNIHEACAEVPSAGIIDRVTEIVSMLGGVDHRPVASLLVAISSRINLSPSERFQFKRIESLKKMVEP